jgi:ParB family chromosome partitioning protein
MIKTLIPQHLSKTADYYTPSTIVEAARKALGAIDLDPASCALANAIVKAAAFYGLGGLAEDGLAEPWRGRVFCNPPGGRVPDSYKGRGTRSNAALWWATLAEAWQAGEVEAAIFVGFTLEILRTAQALDVPQPIDFPLCVPSGRIAFDTPDGPSSSPAHANVIVFLPPLLQGNRARRERFSQARSAVPFVEAFAPIGRCRI